MDKKKLIKLKEKKYIFFVSVQRIENSDSDVDLILKINAQSEISIFSDGQIHNSM